MRTLMSWLMLSVAMVLSLQARAPAAEEKIKPSDLSTRAFHSVNARFPGLAFVSVAKETDPKGEVVYDIELKQRGRKFETDIKADGTILEVEKEIMKKDWPKALRSTVEQKYSKGKVKEVLEVNKVTGKKEVPDHLEVTVETASEKSAEMLLSLDGKKVVKEAQAQTPPPADEDIKPADLPRSITDAVKAKFPNSKVTSAEKGTEGGKPIYEVSINSEKRNIDVTLNPDGEILSYEKTLLPSDRPKKMVDSLKAKYPDATIKLIEEVWDHGKKTGYEGTIITDSKKTIEVTFEANGKLIESGKKK
jgi:uncharacterized membrane protein YkoI